MRVLGLASALLVVLAAVAFGAGFAVDADEMTLVRVPGFVPAETCTITAVSDAHISEAQPDDAFGLSDTLSVAAGAFDARSFVRFDIASCSIPAAAEVRSAALRLTLISAPASDRTWKARRVTGPWAGDVTWNTEPTLAAASTDESPTGIVGGVPLEWDVLPDVAGVVTGALADRGWRFADADEAPALDVAGAVASIEHADPDLHPKLTITWFD